MKVLKSIGIGTPAEGWMERSLEFAKPYIEN